LSTLAPQPGLEPGASWIISKGADYF
jgi:hypothetical protein